MIPRSLWEDIRTYLSLNDIQPLRPLMRGFHRRSISKIIVQDIDKHVLRKMLSQATNITILSVRNCDFDWTCVRLLYDCDVSELSFIELVDCPNFTTVALSEMLHRCPETTTMYRIVRCNAGKMIWNFAKPFLKRIYYASTSAEEDLAIQEFEMNKPFGAVGCALWRLDMYSEEFDIKSNINNINGSLLLTTILSGNHRLIKKLLEKKVRLDGTKDGFTPLHLACSLNDEVAVKLLVNAIDFNMSHTTKMIDKDSKHQRLEDRITDKSWKSLNFWYNYQCKGIVHLACSMSSNNIVKLILDSKNQETPDTLLYTPLDIATKLSNIELVKLLIKYNYKDNQTANALTRACAQKNIELIHLLLNVQHPRFLVSNLTKNYLHICANHGDIDIFEAIIKHSQTKKLLNMYDKYGYTPLFYAAAKGHYQIAKNLLDMGSNPNQSIYYGTPVHAAVVYGHHEILELLLVHKGDLYEKLCPGDGVQVNVYNLVVCLQSIGDRMMHRIIRDVDDLYDKNSDFQKKYSQSHRVHTRMEKALNSYTNGE